MAFKKAERSKHGGKFLFYGKTTSGKTYAALTFPRIAEIDSEAGASDYENKDIEIDGKTYNNLVFVDRTTDIEDLEENLEALLDGEYDGQVDTFVIDSETKLYAAEQLGCLEVAEKQARRKGQDISDVAVTMRGWGRIKNLNMKFQQAKIALSSKGMHVVSVAQGVDITNDDGKPIGIKPDMAKNIQFDYDVIILFFTKKEKDENGNIVVKYYGEVQKDRTGCTKVGDIIENVTYDIWKDYYEKDMKDMKISDSYRNDLKNTTKYVEDKAERSEELATEFKEVLKSFKDNKDALLTVNKLMKEKNISLKNLELQPPETLAELIEFAKLQLD